MKLIGIIGAMEEEVAKLKEQMNEVSIRTKAAMEFNRGKLNGKEVVVVRSGIGKVNAGICTQILVDDYQVDAIINTGIAGSLKSQIDIGDIVVLQIHCSMTWMLPALDMPKDRFRGWTFCHFRRTRIL